LQNYWPRPTHSKNLFFKNTERRLDVILVRIGYAKNIQHARDLIKYGVIFVDNVKITNKNYLVLSTSVVETKYYNSPFLLLYRYHLEHFPTKTKQEWFWRKRYKKKNKCRINREANNHILDGLNLPYSPPSFKLRLKRRLNYHKNAYKYNLKRKVIQFPLTKLPYQYIKVGINKTLITHFCKNHDIRIPTSIFKGANT
jgi:ribosomal protein S4